MTTAAAFLLNPHRRRAPLALALLLAYGPPLAQAQTQSQNQNQTQTQTQTTEPASSPAAATAAPQKIERVLLTGSRISRLKAEGPSAVTVLKSADLDRLGYRNVADALAGLTENTGFTQGEDYGNTWQPAANAISLRGLGPNHTLFLLNGRRVADYPTAYGGQVNFVDTSNIPSAMVERIEVLSGGASAIYGSDAIAGVVNIILKKQVEASSLSLRAGGTELGGGANARAQWVSGFSADRLSGVLSAELFRRDPIWDHQREPFDDSTRFGAPPTTVFGQRNASTQKWVAPPDGACEGLKDLFQGSVSAYNSAKDGVSCASGRARSSFWTNQTGKRSVNLSSTLSFALNPETELFLEGLLGRSTTFQNTRGPNWSSQTRVGDKRYFRNVTSGNLEAWSRRISPEEIGGAERFNREWHDTSYNLALGARGELGGGWSYETSLNSSRYVSKTETPVFLAHADSFFLGPKLGEDAKGVALYAPDPKRLYKPLTPAEFDSIVDDSRRHNESYSHNLSAQISGELLALGGGPLRAAAVAELGRQGYTNKSDPRLGKNYFYSDTPTPDVGGDRSRKALGLELNAPFSKWFTGILAARYDRYDFAQRSDGSSTYNAGFELRPADTVLLRGQFATSFRAPDMNFIYTEQSKGYYASSTDHYRCALAGLELSDKCEFANLSPGFDYTSSSSKNLQSERGKSWNLGVVWAPSADWDASLDFWKVAIAGQIDDLSADTILRNEAACRTGKKDITTPLCVDALKRVRRNPADAAVRPLAVLEILTNPINVADTSTYGFDVSANYRLKTADWGDFTLTGKFSRVLSYVYQASAGDPAENQIGSHDYSGWSQRLNTSLSWKRGDWRHTLSAQRNGRVSSPSNDTDWFGPYWNFNLSSGVKLGKATELNLSLNNVLGKIRYDRETGARKTSYYLPYGRQFWVELKHSFGA